MKRYEEMKKYWDEIGIEHVPQHVVCAANREIDTGLILCGARHWDNVMRVQYKAIYPSNRAKGSDWDQGFIDQFGTFLTRKEALDIAKQNGQSINMDRNGAEGELYSEGLY